MFLRFAFFSVPTFKSDIYLARPRSIPSKQRLRGISGCMRMSFMCIARSNHYIVARNC